MGLAHWSSLRQEPSLFPCLTEFVLLSPAFGYGTQMKNITEILKINGNLVSIIPISTF